MSLEGGWAGSCCVGPSSVRLGGSSAMWMAGRSSVSQDLLLLLLFEPQVRRVTASCRVGMDVCWRQEHGKVVSTELDGSGSVGSIADV